MKNKKPKIAYIIPAPILCGGVAVVCQHANRLARRGFETCIVSVSSEGSLDWFPGQRVPMYPLSSIPADIDIGVATWWETAHDLYRLGISRKFYFVQSDETRFYAEGRYERLFARDSYRFDFECMTEARWIRRWLKDQFGKDAHYVPNGIDREIFHPSEPIEPKGKRARVLIEGPADMPSKGVAEAFRAVRGLDCEVWYVNYRGEPDPSWKPDRYFCRVPMSEMRGVYSSCDILLKLSVVEGSFGPPLEMMACGGACVVANVAGLEEAVVPGENALVVEPGDIDGARRAVERLMEDQTLRRTLIENGAKTIESLDWEKSVDILEKIYLSQPPVGAQGRDLNHDGARHEREELIIGAYAALRKVDKCLRDLVREKEIILQEKSREREAHRREIAMLRHEVNLRNDELNSVYDSKQWKIVAAIKDARHSLAACAKLPFRIITYIIGKEPQGGKR
ncbi:MAG: glycosyltransferase family 4 protein [Candidatus Aureabacteria bacterium]|nr:glycosyltransferase family 4 protein [Candidatus Auribacterota bacterium]